DVINELNYAIIDALDDYVPEVEELEVDKDVRVVYRHVKQERPFEISHGLDGKFEIHIDEIETVCMRTDCSRDAAVRRFARQMRSMGIDDALREKGIQSGDIVRIKDFEFEFIE